MFTIATSFGCFCTFLNGCVGWQEKTWTTFLHLKMQAKQPPSAKWRKLVPNICKWGLRGHHIVKAFVTGIIARPGEQVTPQAYWTLQLLPHPVWFPALKINPSCQIKQEKSWPHLDSWAPVTLLKADFCQELSTSRRIKHEKGWLSQGTSFL